MSIQLKHIDETDFPIDVAALEPSVFSIENARPQICGEESLPPIFECEEGEGGMAMPMPGLIFQANRHGQTESDSHYTGGDARGPAKWEPDFRAERREWTDDEGSATALPGLIVRPGGVVLNVEMPQAAQGLCTTCELRESCTFTKPESGVWRCEEYR